MALRILSSALLLISILFFPFWVSVILAFAGMAYFHLFFEAVFLFLLSDLLYGVKEAQFFGVFFVSFTASILLIALIEIFKRKLKFYS